MKKIRALIVSRHSFFRQALRTYLEGMVDIEMVGEAVDCTEGLSLDQSLKPCLLIVDAGSEGLDILQESIRIEGRDSDPVLILYSLDEPEIYRAGKGKRADACILQDELFERLPPIVYDLRSKAGRFPESGEAKAGRPPAEKGR